MAGTGLANFGRTARAVTGRGFAAAGALAGTMSRIPVIIDRRFDWITMVFRQFDLEAHVDRLAVAVLRFRRRRLDRQIEISVHLGLDRSDALLAHWKGPHLNTCGRVDPRVSAALMERAALFLGNDSGPMHLAAAVDTPAVAVFSRHARPGIGFPLGDRHRIFYPGLSWSGGRPPVERTVGAEKAIDSIPADQVVEACLGFLERQEESSE